MTAGPFLQDPVDEQDHEAREPLRSYHLVLCVEADDFTAPRGVFADGTPYTFSFCVVTLGYVYAVPTDGGHTPLVVPLELCPAALAARAHQLREDDHWWVPCPPLELDTDPGRK